MARRQKHADDRHKELAARIREEAQAVGEDVALDAELRLSEDDDETFLLDELNSAAATYRAILKRAAMALDGRRE